MTKTQFFAILSILNFLFNRTLTRATRATLQRRCAMKMVSRSLTVHKEHEILLKLENAGLNDKLAQKVINSKDNVLAKKVVALIQNNGFMPTTTQRRAREIMGQNFFGIEEAIRHFGISPLKRQFTALAEIPFTEGVLKKYKDTHILVAVFPLSLIQIRSKVAEKEKLFYEQDWYSEEKFAHKKGRLNWRLIRKTPVDNSINKNWSEQQSLLKQDEYTPTVQTMTYTIIGHYLATGERLFERIYVRCNDVSSDGVRAYIGDFASVGLNVNNHWDDFRNDSLAVASARKS